MEETLPVGYDPEVPNTKVHYMPVCLIPDSPVPIPQVFIPATYQSKISLGP